jgi:hypothetical protein
VSYKSVICYGVLAKKEASYAATNTSFSTTADAVLVSELPVIDISYVNDGARPNAPTSAGSLPFMSPTGRFAETSLTMEARGSGSAYTSISTVPPDVHALLEAAGLSASYAGGEITYSPTSSCAQGDSVALRLFARQQQYTVIGGRTTFTTSLTVGSVAGNKVGLSLPQCQIIGITNSEDGPVSISELTIKPSANIGANNDISIIYS